MTRKCALCKEINYKRNKYSFFSAPKDAETRKKWQAALNIKNYTVTDDTYVCSKHFQKSDIITHWVSGIPPQVIKIKYKKCRLRPEAVPSRNFCSVTSSQVVDKHALNKYENKSENKHLLEKNKTFHRKNKNTINCNEDIENENINTCHHTSKSQDYICNYEESDESCIFQSLKDLDEKDVGTHDSKLENSEFERKILAEICEEDNDNNPCLDFTESINSMNVGEEGNQMYDKSFCAKTFKTVDYDIKRHDSTKKNDTIAVTWKHNTPSTDSSLKENTINNGLKINDSYIDDQVTTLNYNHLDMQNKEPYDGINEDELLFEDFLEICTEIVIPSNWSCLVTSKGYGTTVVYLCMSITKYGLPFVEKQIFIRSDMILHYVVANNEIDPLMHNLVKDIKHIKLKNLVELEILIDEFNQRFICQGIYNTRNYKGIDTMHKYTYMDGIKWRHISCSLIINNDSTRCTKCVRLSHTLLRIQHKDLF